MAGVGQKYGITGSQDAGWTFTGTLAGVTGSFSGVVDVSNGTAAAPAVTFTSDTDTGFFRTSANVLGVAAGGSSVGTFSSTGFTGAVNGTVGATTPAAGAFTTLSATGVTTHAVGSVGTPSIIFSGDTNTGLYWIGADSFGLAANGVVQCTITTGGINGVIGATTAAAGSFTTLSASSTFTLGGTAVTATATEINEVVQCLDIADGSADSTYYVVCPHAGAIGRIWTVIDDVVSTADITITANIGATPVTDGVVTIATAGSAAGDVDSATPSAANVVTAGQAINFVVAGGGAGGAPRIHLAFTIVR